MELGDIEWGDVLVDTGDVMVCEGTVDGDSVVAKRWSHGALDAELAARRALAGAGVPAAQLLGWGDGWLVVEDLGETMWRPVHPGEADEPVVARALGAWWARVHEVDGAGLPRPAQEALMEQGLAGAAADLLPASLGPVLDGCVPGWLERSRAGTSLLVGGFSTDEVAVVGQGLEAMATEWSQAHQGLAAEDLLVVRRALDAQAFDAFRAGYEGAGGRWPAPDEWEAAEGLAHVLGIAVSDLTGHDVDPVALRWLEERAATR